MCVRRPDAARRRQQDARGLGHGGGSPAAPTGASCRTAARPRRKPRRPAPAMRLPPRPARTRWIMPMRLTMRLASLVAMISRRSRWPRMSRLEPSAHGLGKGGEQFARPAPDRRARCCARAHPAAPAWRSTAAPPARAGSARARRRRGAAGCRSAARPSVARSSWPAASSMSISRRFERIAAAPPASAIDSASACSRLSSSTSAATSSVIAASSLTRAGSLSRPARLAAASAILMLTSLSEQSTPAELSMKSVLIRPPARRLPRARIRSGRPG